MRILRIIADMDATRGGPIEGLTISAKHHRDWGHETEIVTLDSPNTSYVLTCPFRIHAVGPGIRRDRYTSRLAPTIDTLAPNFDVAVVHGLWNHASRGAGRPLNRAGLPYVVFTHGMLDPWFRKKYPLKHIAKQLYWWAGQGGTLSGAARVLFTTEEEKLLARNMFFGHNDYKGEVVSYGANAPNATDRANGHGAFAAVCPLPEQARYMLFLSRIHEKKGLDLLIEALPRILKSDRNLHIVVAGPDQQGLATKFAQRAAALGYADRVHFPGMLTGAQKWGAFLGAEAFVLPSHQENFGIAVAEALACGLPVLITDKVNIWREVAATGAGLVASDTLVGIRDLLVRWSAMSSQDKLEMRMAAVTCYQTHFESERAASDLLSILNCVAKNRISPIWK